MRLNLRSRRAILSDARQLLVSVRSALRARHVVAFHVERAHTAASVGHQDWEPHIQGGPKSACVFSWVLMNTGEPELGQALLERATTWLEDTLPAAIEHSDRYAPDVCYLVAGDNEKALASLETQLAHGHFESWPFDHQMPMYNPIEHEPRYRELLAERERRIAEQRELIEQMRNEPAL